jgi:hypothetical protein
MWHGHTVSDSGWELPFPFENSLKNVFRFGPPGCSTVRPPGPVAAYQQIHQLPEHAFFALGFERDPDSIRGKEF